MFYICDVEFYEGKEARIKEEPKAEEKVEDEDRLVEFDCHSGEPEDMSDGIEDKPQLSPSTRVMRPPDYHGKWVTIGNAEIREPKTAMEAILGDDNMKWREAVKKELESLKQNKVSNLNGQ